MSEDSRPQAQGLPGGVSRIVGAPNLGGVLGFFTEEIELGEEEMKAFEVELRLSRAAVGGSFTGVVHTRRYEAPSEEYLRESFDPQWEVLSLKEIEHPGTPSDGGEEV